MARNPAGPTEAAQHETSKGLPWWPPVWLLLWRSDRDDERQMNRAQVRAQKAAWIGILVVSTIIIVAIASEVFYRACSGPCLLAPS